MWNELRERPGLVFGGGLVAGLALGAAAVVGCLATMLWQGEAPSSVAFTPLHADSSSNSDNFAVATGPLDEDMEMYATLDFVSGDLTVWALGKITAKLSGKFTANVLAGLPPEKGKKAHYLMVTGLASFQAQAGGQPPGKSAIYVLDSNSGKFVIYAVPWSRVAAANGQNQGFPLIPLDSGKAQNVAIRPKAGS